MKKAFPFVALGAILFALAFYSVAFVFLLREDPIPTIGYIVIIFFSLRVEGLRKKLVIYRDELHHLGITSSFGKVSNPPKTYVIKTILLVLMILIPLGFLVNEALLDSLVLLWIASLIIYDRLIGWLSQEARSLNDAQPAEPIANFLRQIASNWKQNLTILLAALVVALLVGFWAAGSLSGEWPTLGLIALYLEVRISSFKHYLDSLRGGLATLQTA